MFAVQGFLRGTVAQVFSVMGVAAGLDCLKGISPASIDGHFFATATSPYREKQISVIAAMA